MHAQTPGCQLKQRNSKKEEEEALMAFCIAAPSCGESLVGRYENSKTDYSRSIPTFYCEEETTHNSPSFFRFSSLGSKKTKKKRFPSWNEGVFKKMGRSLRFGAGFFPGKRYSSCQRKRKKNLKPLGGFFLFPPFLFLVGMDGQTSTDLVSPLPLLLLFPLH